MSNPADQAPATASVSLFRVAGTTKDMLHNECCDALEGIRALWKPEAQRLLRLTVIVRNIDSAEGDVIVTDDDRAGMLQVIDRHHPEADV